MPAPQTSYVNFSSQNVNVPTTVETVIATTRAVSSPSPGTSFAILASFAFFAGVAATGIILNIRRNSLTGTLIYAGGTLAVTAGQTEQYAVGVVDSLIGDVAGALWVVTVTQVAATGAGTAANIFTNVIVPV